MRYEWQQSWSVGNKHLDNQHKKLIFTLNTLHDLTIDEKIENTKDIIDFLVEYAEQHFQDEEAYMEKFNYPELDTHCDMHESYRKAISAMKHQYDNEGSSQELARKIADFASSWLKNHIIGQDKKYCVFISNDECPT
jgi:hemerythrin